jgi:ATP-dependent exoDNAse (exonuclease V) beta subunit
LVSDDEALHRLAEARGRVLGATAKEIAAARDLAVRVLQHPLLHAAKRAAAAGQCYREAPVTWRVAEQTIVEGNVDLAYVDGEEVVVVDFKTDRELEGALDAYRRQVQVYAAAISSALGLRARGVLMRV